MKTFETLYKVLIMALTVVCLPCQANAKHAEKPRILVLTDIENEPDDAMSLENRA